jgi:hypothetical protein
MAILPSSSSASSCGPAPTRLNQTKTAENDVYADPEHCSNDADADEEMFDLGFNGDEECLLKNKNDGEVYNKWEMYRHGNSLSPEMFDALQTSRSIWESTKTTVGAALLVLIGVPLIAYGSLFPANTLPNYIIAIWSAWDGLLSISSLLVSAFTLAGAFVYVELAHSVQPLPPRKSTAFEGDLDPDVVDSAESCCNSSPADGPVTVKGLVKRAKTYVFTSRQRLFTCTAGAVLVFVLFMLGVVSPYSLIYPSWLWHPLLWGRYHVYNANEVMSAVHHICQDEKSLCLNKREWEVLSSGALSPANRNDVSKVMAGQAYAKENSIVITVLARNIKDVIPALRANVESIAPLFKMVSLVVFENDSDDGTREELKQWSMETGGKKYVVDVMECEGVVDCKYNRIHRDSVDINYDYSPSVGEMHNYRNRGIQYIRSDPKYKDFSHLLVLDVDLAVPFSPLGILHTLGSKPDHAVASCGRQPFPSSFGSFTTPYDLNAFREYNTPQTMGLETWHNRFCSIMPPGERWHSECDALSPSHLIAMLWSERKIMDEDLYRVRSAFNGAVLYPMELLRQTGALYDDGEPSKWKWWLRNRMFFSSTAAFPNHCVLLCL